MYVVLGTEINVLTTYDGMDRDYEKNFIAENGLLIRSPFS